MAQVKNFTSQISRNHQGFKPCRVQICVDRFGVSSVNIVNFISVYLKKLSQIIILGFSSQDSKIPSLIIIKKKSENDIADTLMCFSMESLSICSSHTFFFDLLTALRDTQCVKLLTFFLAKGVGVVCPINLFQKSWISEELEHIVFMMR